MAQLEGISSHPVACYLGEETNAHLATPSFQVVVESEKVSPEPSFLQTKRQLPQLLLIRLVLQALPQLHCPSLDVLQHLNVLSCNEGPRTKHRTQVAASLALSTGGGSLPWSCWPQYF